MGKFSLSEDDDFLPIPPKVSKRLRLLSTTSESSCSNEPSRSKQRTLQDFDDPDQIPQPDEESLSPDENPKSPIVNSDKSISAVFTDPDVLDCCICFEPLTIPVFQCENGHIACSSCCTGVSNKCPSCSWPIGYNRCRAIEKVLESVKITCQNKHLGCEQTVTYSNKKDHELNCHYSPCSCPLSHCDFLSSHKLLYDHFRSQHRDFATQFSFNVELSVPMDAIDRFLVLQESSERVLFILHCSVEALGHAIWLSCIAPTTSTVYSYDLSAKNEENILRLQSNTKFVQSQFDLRPQTGYLLVPFGFCGLALATNLSFNLCISEQQ